MRDEHAPGEQGAPFRAMVDCDAVNKRLAWIVGPGFTVSGGYAIVSQYGAAGQRMHSGPFYGHSQGYRLVGRRADDGLNIGWALRDVVTARGDGGLMLIPGSHKSRLPLPLPPSLSCDLPQVKHVEMRAGDVVIYMVTHGVRAWRAEHERRFVATKVSEPRTPRL
jgi:ectoine hydroxylase-related dioxygenase (phytanoyl-CoA dioxygenase family)